MDNFMDKLAQKFSAQEVIKANSQAEAAEMKKLQIRVAEYEKILQEMRKLNYKNSELSDKMDGVVGENADKIQELQEEETRLLAVLKELTQEQTRIHEENVALNEAKRAESEKQEEEQKQRLAALEQRLSQSDEFVHKENVKVYRNVQAIVVEEIKNQTQLLQQENEKLGKRQNTVMILSIFAVLFSIAGIAFQIIFGLQLLPF